MTYELAVYSFFSDVHKHLKRIVDGPEGGLERRKYTKNICVYLCSKFQALMPLQMNGSSLLSDNRSRVRTTLRWVFLQFCQFHMCTIQEQSRGKSFLERFLSKSQNQKKLDPFSVQIVLGCVDPIFDSILLI